jgi:hypothetical protein
MNNENNINYATIFSDFKKIVATMVSELSGVIDKNVYLLKEEY